MSKVIVSVSVDWDADCSKARFEQSLDRDIKGFNKRMNEVFGEDVPVTQFICPAFYLRNRDLARAYTDMINDALRPIDEVGLHVHCWKTLVEKALGEGTYKDTPSAFDGGEPEVILDGVVDEGRGVPLGAYTQDQITSIVRTSTELLGKLDLNAKANQGVITSFRCGGWFTNDDVFRALVGLGFTHEASPVACASLAGGRDPSVQPMFDILEALWDVDRTEFNPVWRKNSIRRRVYPRGVTSASQPVKILGSLTLVPDTGGLAEYIASRDMKRHVKHTRRLVPENGDLHVSLGYHHNNRGGWPRLVEALQAIARVTGPRLKFKLIKDIKPVTFTWTEHDLEMGPGGKNYQGGSFGEYRNVVDALRRHGSSSSKEQELDLLNRMVTWGNAQLENHESETVNPMMDRLVKDAERRIRRLNK